MCPTLYLGALPKGVLLAASLVDPQAPRGCVPLLPQLHLLLPEAQHHGYAVEEFAIGETALSTLLCLHKCDDLFQCALCLGGCQHLPLDLLVSKAADQVVKHHVVRVDS